MLKKVNGFFSIVLLFLIVYFLFIKPEKLEFVQKYEIKIIKTKKKEPREEVLFFIMIIILFSKDENIISCFKGILYRKNRIFFDGFGKKI